MKIAFALGLFFAFIAHYVVGECCNRKPDFGCCGNGPCNIFCCNCDDGCNKACETSCCDTYEYVKCIGSITEAIAECATAVEIPLCIAEILGVGSDCYKCYIGCDTGSRSEIDTFAAYAKDNLEKGVPKIDLSSLTHATQAQLAEAKKHDTNGDGHFTLAEFTSYNKASAAKKASKKQNF